MKGYLYVKNHRTYCELGHSDVVPINAEWVYEMPTIEQAKTAETLLHKQFADLNIQYEVWTPFYSMQLCGMIAPLLIRYGITFSEATVCGEAAVGGEAALKTVCGEAAVGGEAALKTVCGEAAVGGEAALEEDIDVLEKSMKSLKIDLSASLMPPASVMDKKQVITEDLGKIFEMAVCLLYEIEYDGKYKYSMVDAEKIKQKIHKLKEVFPYRLQHVAKNGNKYDFVVISETSSSPLYLSAKTTKKDGKVCPQVIGQPSKEKFCKHFEITDTYDLEKIKHHIQENVNKMLYVYAANTFNCPIIYYNQHKNKILFIMLKEDIEWSNYDITFSHIIKNKIWNESSSIAIDNITIGEFQLHNHRDCIKFRWAFENVLNLFARHFDIADLS